MSLQRDKGKQCWEMLRCSIPWEKQELEKRQQRGEGRKTTEYLRWEGTQQDRQTGWGPGQPGLALNEEVGGPACGRGVGLS